MGLQEIFYDNYCVSLEESINCQVVTLFEAPRIMSELSTLYQYHFPKKRAC